MLPEPAPPTLTSDGERDWERLTEWVAVAPDFFLIFVFTDDRRAANIFRTRWITHTEHTGRSSRMVVCDAPGELVTRALPALVDAPVETTVWIEGMGAQAHWQTGWDEAARRWNERRERLLRARTGGMIVCAPAWARPVIRDAAPDLWSFASMFAFPVCTAGSPLLDFTIPIEPELPEATDADRQLARTQAARAMAWQGPAEARRTQLVDAASALVNAGLLGEAEPVVDAALKVHDPILTGSEAESEQPGDFSTSLSLANVLDALSRQDDQLTIYQEKILPRLAQQGDWLFAAVIHSFAARVLWEQGNRDQALALMRTQVLPIVSEPAAERPALWGMYLISEVLFDMKLWDDALPILSECVLPQLKRESDRRSYAITEMRMATILGARGHTDEALRLLHEECIPDARRLQDRNLVSSALLLAVVIRLEGFTDVHNDLTRIAAELSESLSLARTSESVDGHWFACESVAHLLAEADRIHDARRLLADAVAAFERLGATEQARQARELADSLA